MDTFIGSVEAALLIEDVMAAFAKRRPQTPLLIDDGGKSEEVAAELVPIFRRLADDFKNGRPVGIVSLEKVFTTQQAADFIGVSRPTLIALLDQYRIPYSLVGTHRRIEFQAIQSLQVMMKQRQRDLLDQIHQEGQDSGEFDAAL